MSINYPNGLVARPSLVQALSQSLNIKPERIEFSDTVAGKASSGLDAIHHLPTAMTWLIPEIQGAVQGFTPPILVTTASSYNILQLNIDKKNFQKRNYSFDGGFTLYNGLEVVEFGGVFYRWSGVFPKVVDVNTEALEAGWISVSSSIHRSSSVKDLLAVDRRPDGYADSPANVLATGQDLQINRPYTINEQLVLQDNQVIEGVGGTLTTSYKGAGIYATGKNGLRIKNAVLTGIIENGPVTNGAGYGGNFSNCDDLFIDGIKTSSFTGSLLLTRCINSVIRNIYSRRNRFHSDVAAGAYGVVLQGCKWVTVDGIDFLADASLGDLGRHAFYVSTDSSDPDSQCEHVTIKNVKVLKKKINNRVMFDGVIRRSKNTTITDFDMSGSNGGISLFTANGPISDTTIKNGSVEVFSYNNSLAIYGIDTNISEGLNGAADIQRLRIQDVKVKISDGEGLSNGFMTGINLCCENSSVVDTEIIGSSKATPIQINGGNNIIIRGITDVVTDSATPTNPLIKVTAATSNLTVNSVSTTRAVITGLDFVTNMTVDYTRRAQIVNTAGVLTRTDTNNMISSVVFEGNNVAVTFKDHVTQAAINNATMETLTANTLFLITQRSGRKVVFRITDLAGTVKAPTTSYTLTLNLYS